MSNYRLIVPTVIGEVYSGTQHDRLVDVVINNANPENNEYPKDLLSYAILWTQNPENISVTDGVDGNVTVRVPIVVDRTGEGADKYIKPGDIMLLLGSGDDTYYDVLNGSLYELV